MSIDIDAFISETGGDRARSYLFEWYLPPTPELNLEIPIPGIDFDLPSAKYYVKSSSIPESSVEEVSTYWQGTQYKAAGSRRFSDWIVTVLGDEGGYLRSLCDVWMQNIHTILPDINRYGIAKESMNPLSTYFRSQIFAMLDSEGDTTLLVALKNTWPKSIGPISLDYETNDFASFDITFAYQYHIIAPSFGLG